MTYDGPPPSTHVRTYNWPPLQLNFWIFVILLASTSIIGVFATFIQTQSQLELGIPWYDRLMFKNRQLNANKVQVLPLLHHRWLPLDPLHPRYFLAY